jgi:two-component system sensor histidine kinase KdpD
MEKRDNAERRPSPDALLREVQQAERGRLKIFLGAAPGVAYEMLTAARAKKVEGIDVVVGVVETHGRKETGALLQGAKSSRAGVSPIRAIHLPKWTLTPFWPAS